MPRTIIARPPGGASGNVCRRYAVRQKLQLLEECNRLQRSRNHSIHSAAVEMGISPCLLVRWYQKRPQFKASLSKSKAICEGPEGQLHHIKEQLLQWIFSWREQGIALTMTHVVHKATSILHHQEDDDTSFKDNGFTARLSAMTRFLAKYNFLSNQDQRGYQVTGGGVQGGVGIHGEGLSMSLWTPSRSTLHLEHGPDARLFFVSPLAYSRQA